MSFPYWASLLQFHCFFLDKFQPFPSSKDRNVNQIYIAQVDDCEPTKWWWHQIGFIFIYHREWIQLSIRVQYKEPRRIRQLDGAKIHEKENWKNS